MKSTAQRDERDAGEGAERGEMKMDTSQLCTLTDY